MPRPLAYRPEQGPIDPRKQARLVPYLSRSLLAFAEDRGVSADSLCRGLGFSPDELNQHDFLLSHQQARTLILRAQRLLKDPEPALGLALGARQTPHAWGLTGVAMQTCETLGQAIHLALENQGHAGSILEHRLSQTGALAHLSAEPRQFDLQIEPFLVEESFASSVAILRFLVGPHFNPSRVEFAFPSHGHDALYQRFFRCPVHFKASAHRLSVELRWFEEKLPGYERGASELVRAQLSAMLRAKPQQDELLESLSQRMRIGIEEPPRQGELAQQINISARTLRRRLGEQSTSFLELRDAARFERARDLLKNSEMTVNEIADLVGYADARAFRRAFKRWSGMLPSAFRSA
ncbi:AraC family transcriptional regulator [Paucibacter sp. Y2R2-4]|uniref:AraC family transcriptional regulator n=1 Tax=Paucibacter sp. Y2R2-4 TaxID=2893553 RepID=UPI0021E4CE52|nr:AraC family transcriptional regulator [Paucibacter sp. Y2R2-4]MCV2351226.1 AraC family transcriptional regulator [Paucibacter sp. Y2R2-4]